MGITSNMGELRIQIAREANKHIKQTIETMNERLEAVVNEAKAAKKKLEDAAQAA